ncbi:hypothetical protein KB206_02445 [Microvirga sp. STS02]|uniref:hypothetical protein n=1 Tax=Hymenobacter negativus TaxID=2795026 RepID=UPI0018DCD122|nr:MULTISPECIES: hypothetical protein [Bacteria]MBH8567726.1 hypothetical protein [Hymenobacter negativus]MBR7207460.1 hypothetical protein [Microvirga sp. STS02]
MNGTEPASPSAFDKARTGLWTSLQKHLTTVYAAESAFVKAVAFTDSFPFPASVGSEQQLYDYEQQRRALRDLFTDETTQLDTLVKAIRQKGYAEDEKKQLYLLLLGYMDIAATVFARLHTQVPVRQPKDEELDETTDRFARVQKFARLNIKGIAGLLGGI